MRGRLLLFGLFCWLLTAGLTSRSFAQTITTGALAPTTVCQGGNVTVTFVTSGTFAATNVFSLQLSDVTGNFSASTVVIGTATAAGSVRGTIPASTTGGGGYRLRVVSSAPAIVGSTAAQTLTVNVPALPSVSPPPAYCQDDVAAVLVATPSTGGSLNWYGTSVNGGTASGTAPKPPTNTVGTQNYYVSQTINGCEGPRAGIPVIVKGRPAAPQTQTVGYCVGQSAVPVSASGISGAVLNWYTASTGGTGTVAAPSPSTAAPGTTTFYVTQVVNGCEGPRASLAVNVTTPPPAPSVTNPAPYCQGTTATTLVASGTALRWYGTNATGGSGSSIATVPLTTSATTTTYYVTQTVNGCESARAGISVTVRSAPAMPTVPASVTYCQNQNATALQATPATNGVLNWYGTSPTGGTSASTAPVPRTNQDGTLSYYVSQTLDGCESPRAVITVLVKSQPASPSIAGPLTTCQNKTGVSLSATAAPGGSLNWYGTNATGGTASSTSPVVSTSALGTTVYYVSQTLNGCESQRAELSVVVGAVPAKPTISASTNTSPCAGTVASALSASPSSGGTLVWYGTNATGGTPSPVATTPSTATAGTSTYYVAQSLGGCESERVAIPITVRNSPPAPGVSSVEFCQNTQPGQLTATLLTGAEARWFNSPTGGNAQPIPPALSNNTVGTSSYYVSQTLDGCESPRATVNVRVKAVPTVPGVSPVSFCQGAQADILTASGTNLKWFDAFDAILGEAPRPSTNNVGTQTYKVSQVSSEGCESTKAPIVVTINARPSAPAVRNLTYCQSQPDQPSQSISPLQADGQNLRWYNLDGNAFGNTPTPSIERAGEQRYAVSQTVNNCEGAKSTLVVTINSVPAPTVARSQVSYCINDQAVPLQATGENGAKLQWVDPYQHVTDNAPTPATTNTNVQPDGDPFYVYQIGPNGCYSPRSVIRVVVNSAPTLALQAPTQTVNLGATAPLQLKFTGSGPYSYTLTGNYTGVSRSSDTTIMVLPRGNTTYQVAGVRNGCGIGLPGNPATAQITVRVPTVTTTALSTQTICAGLSLAVPFTTTGQFNSGNTFLYELASVSDTSRKFTVPATATGSPVTGTLPTTLPGGQYYVRVKASNPEVGITGTNSPSLLTIRSRPSAVLSGTQNIYEGVPANLTMTLGGDGPWTIAYTDSLRSYTATASSSPYVLEVRPVRTTAYRITTVSNGCGNGTISGSATVTVVPLLGVVDNPLDPLVKAYPVPTSTVITVELDLSLHREPAELSLINGQGRPVLERTTRDQRNELDLSTQPSGLYLLRIRVGDRQTVRKVMKQ